MRLTSRCFLIAAALAAISCSRTKPSAQTSPTPEQQTESVLPYSGEMWLKWDKSARLAFVMGNLRGLWDGQGAGCGEAKILVMSLPGVKEEASEQIRFRCASKLKLSNRSFESYEQVVTDFYSRYPDLRQIEVQDLVQLLAYDFEAKLTAKDLRERISTSR